MIFVTNALLLNYNKDEDNSDSKLLKRIAENYLEEKIRGNIIQQILFFPRVWSCYTDCNFMSFSQKGSGNSIREMARSSHVFV